MFDFGELQQAIILGKGPLATELTQKAINEECVPKDILNQGLIAGMDVVGVKFKNGEYYLPQVLLAARAMKAAVVLLHPLIVSAGIQPIGTLVLGTVKGDLHDVGKNLVAMLFQGAGFNVIDLGVDVSSEKFVEAVRENKPDILGMSSLLTTSMREMQDVIQALQEAGLRDKVKIMVGGAPITQQFADKIGADAYALEGGTAVEMAKAMVN